VKTFVQLTLVGETGGAPTAGLDGRHARWSLLAADEVVASVSADEPVGPAEGLRRVLAEAVLSATAETEQPDAAEPS
jgi:hypothetical protein